MYSDNCGGNYNNQRETYNTYGLSTSFLNNLGIEGPLHTKVFIANLDYKVDAKKLKEVFKLAGRLINVDFATGKDGSSRGFAIIEYDHPVEAVQAISMFDHQMLYERRMTVRLDRLPHKNEKFRLPEGLGGIGIGLGPNGEPLRNVASNLPNQNVGTNSVPAPVVAPQNGSNMMGQGSNALGDNLAALNSVVGNLGNIGALSNPLLSNAAATLNGLNSNDLGNLLSSNYNSQQQSSNFNAGGYGGGGSMRNDFDGSNSVRNYNTQPQDDFNCVSNFNNQQMGGGNNARSSNTILIRNLPPSYTWQTLRDKFRDIGEVKFAEIRGQDCGVVRFSKDREAELAIKIVDGARFDGHTLQVCFF